MRPASAKFIESMHKLNELTCMNRIKHLQCQVNLRIITENHSVKFANVSYRSYLLLFKLKSTAFENVAVSEYNYCVTL